MDVLGVAGVLAELPRERTQLLSNLGRLRRTAGPITPELADTLADHMNLRRGDVHEVASFYSFLQVPVDAVRVCTGPVCDCFGARELLAREPGGIEVPCLGHCDLAPVLLRGDSLEPALAHSTNDGPSLGLAGGDATAAALEVPPVERIVEELHASGLAGYGGAGFPAALKWEAVLREPGPRVLVVNADEGEPGTIKDRYVLELRPRLLVEALRIVARALDVMEVDTYIYIREEYGVARARLEAALAEARIGAQVVVGAGAYIAGEETAMLESMEGRRAMPRLRPPFPAQRGHLERPTLVHNVETLAHLPALLRLGGEAWAALGRRGARGVRLWSVSGAVRRPGCYEAPNGITARELVEEHAGGFDGEPGAIVPGGAASGILPPDALDAPLTRDGLAEHGAGVGSAGVQVFPAGYPPLRLLERTYAFFAEESCGKCTPCRIGNRALHHLVERLGHGEALMPRARMEEWLEAMERTSICGLGQASPVPIRNAMRIWPELFAPLAATVG
jgi:NADH:ubiquinone oxidoreductase subunit F (NADH-binding)